MDGGLSRVALEHLPLRKGILSNQKASEGSSRPQKESQGSSRRLSSQQSLHSNLFTASEDRKQPSGSAFESEFALGLGLGCWSGLGDWAHSQAAVEDREQLAAQVLGVA